MTPFYNKERVGFGLRYGFKPEKGKPVSGVVLVVDDEGKGFTYIRFADGFVEAVGKALPYGTGADTPSYIKVMYLRSKKVWRVIASYLDNSRSVLLWETPDKPAWLKRIRREP